ncbi:MAG TPA: NPCBM/NEW2 domain-containing protein [Actinopolymorphaceae bacterium]
MARIRRTAAAAAVSLVSTFAMSLAGAAVHPSPAFGEERAESRPAASDPVEVQLLSLTDFHGQLPVTTSESDGYVTDSDGTRIPVGGAAYLAAHLKRLRAEENSITFSTGDNFSGWPKLIWSAQDEPTIEVLDTLGVQFSAVGNHELDVNLSFLVDHMVKGKCFGRIGLDSCFTDSTGRRFHGTDFPYLSGNIVTTKGKRHVLPGTHIEWVSVPGSDRKLPVGFINLTLPSTQDGLGLDRSYHPTLDSLPIIETANEEAARLRREGIRAIVLNVHQGAGTTGGFNDCTDVTGTMMDANASLSPEIDAIVTGHWHHAFTCMVDDPAGNPRPLVEAGHAGRVINEIVLQLDPSTGEVLRDRTVSTNHAVTHDIDPDPAMERIVDYWTEKNVRTRGIPVARIAEDVTSVRTSAGESALGNLIADAYLHDGRKDDRSDLALLVTRSGAEYGNDLTVEVGSELGDEPGVITAGDSWNSVEYASNLLTVSITGAQIEQILEQQWQRQDDGSVTFVPLAVSKNVRYAYDLSKPVGQRVDPAEVLIDGKPLQLSRTYRVTAPILTIHGRDGITAFEGFTKPVRHDRMRDAFRWYLTKLGTVRAPATNRVEARGADPIEVSGTAYLSDVPWMLAYSGWRTVARDTEVGGNPLRIAGVTYEKGLGLNAPGEVVYALGGRCSRLTATVGVDDYVKDYETGATARFQAYADGEKVFDSGTLRPGTPVAVDVPMTGVETLALRVTDGADGSYGDRGDWADAKVTCEG